jgi:calreticulin
MKHIAVVLLLSIVALSSAKVFFEENFNDDSWKSNWVQSKNKGDLAGEWTRSAGEFSHDEKDTGLKTSTDYRFYQLSRTFDSFSNKDDTLVFQFSVKNEQRLDCGGGYLKLLPSGFDQNDFSGDTPYYIMFGPDICGTTKRIHVIFNYKGENHLISSNIPCETDTYTHVYTLIVKPDQTYQVLVDGKEKKSGSLTTDWDFLPPKQIKDPNQSKPTDWVDNAQIPDPTATKPDGWDDIPKLIRDPDASQPDDWDSDLDGDWEAPLIPNPDYQGEWEPPFIPNPDYKGAWVHPLIDNPEYYEDDSIYAYSDISAVGVEIWQVKSGTIFDNILVTNDVDSALKAAEKIATYKDAEKEQEQAENEANSENNDEERTRLEEEFGEFDEDHSHEEL